MKIDLVSEHASPLAAVGAREAGGQNVHVAALARSLAALGADVRVLTRRDDPDVATSVELAPGIVVVHVDAGPPEPLARDELWPHMRAFGDGVAARWADDPPTVAHAHFWMSGAATVAAAAQVPVPVALTYHALGAEKRKHQGTSDTSPSARLGTEAALGRTVDLIVATTRQECRTHLTAGVPPSRLAYVPCGVDLTRFRPPVDHRLQGDRRTQVGVLGRLVERKGLGDLFEALRHRPEVDVVVIGGDGPPATDPTIARYRALAASLGVAAQVRFTGPVERARMPDVLSDLDLVVCCPWYEPFGLVALEAMASGLPVVATRVGGLAETVVHDVTGLLVPPRDPAALAEAIGVLATDPARRSRMGMSGRRRALRYSWSRVGAATIEAYQRMLGEQIGAGWTRGQVPA